MANIDFATQAQLDAFYASPEAQQSSLAPYLGAGRSLRDVQEAWQQNWQATSPDYAPDETTPWIMSGDSRRAMNRDWMAVKDVFSSFAPSPVTTAPTYPEDWQQSQDFLSWAPQQEWFAYMSPDATPDQVLASLDQSYSTAGQGAQDIIDEAYKVFQAGGGAARETMPFTQAYDPQDTWGAKEFNPFDDDWDFQYYLAQQGLGDMPSGPRPGSGAWQYAQDPDSLYTSQYTQEGVPDFTTSGSVTGQTVTDDGVTITTSDLQNLFSSDGFEDFANYVQSAYTASGFDPTPMAQEYVPQEDLSLQVTDGFPTRGGIKTGYWEDNEYIFPDPETQRIQIGFGAQPQIDVQGDPMEDPYAVGGVVTPEVLRNLTPTYINASMPNWAGRTADNQWGNTFLNDITSAPLFGDFTLNDILPDVDFNIGWGSDQLGSIGEQYSTGMGTAGGALNLLGSLAGGTGGFLTGLLGRGLEATEQANIAGQVLDDFGAIYDPSDYEAGGDAWLSAFLPLGDTILNNMAGDIGATTGIAYGQGGEGFTNIAQNWLSANTGADISGSPLDFSAFYAPTAPVTGISVPSFTYTPDPNWSAPITVTPLPSL